MMPKTLEWECLSECAATLRISPVVAHWNGKDSPEIVFDLKGAHSWACSNLTIDAAKQIIAELSVAVAKLED